jgi:hypothetical protein
VPAAIPAAVISAVVRIIPAPIRITPAVIVIGISPTIVVA